MRSLVFTNANGVSITFKDYPYLITKLEGLALPSGEVQTQKAPYQDGNTYIDYLFSAREITLEGAIYSKDLTTIQAHKRLLITALNPKLGPGTLVYYNGTVSRQATCLVVSSPLFNNKDAREPLQQFQAQFYCPDPYWYAITGNVQGIGYATGIFEFDMEFATTIELSEASTIKSRTINNNGDAETSIIMTFYGPATNPWIINETTGKYLRMNYTLTAGDVWQANTAQGSKTITINTGSGNGMQYLDIGSDFWGLAIGYNVISFYDDSGSTTARATVAWSEKFLGV